MKVLTIVGARPQFVKAAMVSRALRQQGSEYLVHTGQHYDENMSDIFFEELDLPKADVNLGVGSGTHAEQTAAMLVGIERSALAEQPDWILVYGDTNSTLAGALVAAKLHIPLAHVEAGLRSFNRDMPEEINRVLCDHVSDILFCPTAQAVENLATEGIRRGVHCVGDVMCDALTHFLGLARQRRPSGLDADLGRYVLLTIHRPVNTDSPQNLAAIFAALQRLTLRVIFPVHPRTRQALQRLGLAIPVNVQLIEPVGYLDMLALESRADCILTDSGGIQKEAYWLGVRCVTLRDETEWVETVQMGWNRLTGADSEAIVTAVSEWYPAQERLPVYGDGHASERIVEILANSIP